VDTQVDVKERTMGLSHKSGRIIVTTLLLMALSCMMILMVNVPGSRAMAATPPLARSDALQAMSGPMHRVAARSSDDSDQVMSPRRKRPGVQVASLGREQRQTLSDVPSLSGGAVRWTASSGCLHPTLRRITTEPLELR
jgi:hypothetical protein